jgi:hypothetical protein
MASLAYVVFLFVQMIQGKIITPSITCIHNPSRLTLAAAGYEEPAVSVLTTNRHLGYPTPIIAACSDALNWRSFSTTVAATASEAESQLKMTLGDIPTIQVWRWLMVCGDGNLTEAHFLMWSCCDLHSIALKYWIESRR